MKYVGKKAVEDKQAEKLFAKDLRDVTLLHLVVQLLKM